MIYRQTINVERIVLSPLDNPNSRQFLEFVKHGDEPKFAVFMKDSEGEWFWEFDMSEPSDYERVKMNTYDAIFGCDTMDELGEALDAIYEEGFEEILIDGDDDCDCDYEYDEEDEFDDDEEEYDEEIDEDECANCNRRDECLHYKQRGR